ncbi:hypothetical protein H671_20775 [Cricetulus griseus]|nr:hypothetical protein H671_20775 [Cricetulus griseus]
MTIIVPFQQEVKPLGFNPQYQYHNIKQKPRVLESLHRRIIRILLVSSTAWTILPEGEQSVTEGIHNGQAETWQQGAGVAAGTRIGSLYPQPKHRAGKADWERCGSFHSQSLTPVTYFVPQGNAS